MQVLYMRKVKITKIVKSSVHVEISRVKTFRLEIDCVTCIGSGEKWGERRERKEKLNKDIFYRLAL